MRTISPFIALPEYKRKRYSVVKINMNNKDWRTILHENEEKKKSTPFFKILNESGTVEHFIHALNKKSEQEVKGYLSKWFPSDIRFEEIYEFFSKLETYHYLKKFQMGKRKKICTVSIDLGNNGIVHIKVVREPDQYGIWKILEIQKE